MKKLRQPSLRDITFTRMGQMETKVPPTTISLGAKSFHITVSEQKGFSFTQMPFSTGSVHSAASPRHELTPKLKESSSTVSPQKDM